MTRKHWLRAAVAALLMAQVLLSVSAFAGAWLAGMGAPGLRGSEPAWGEMAISFAMASAFSGLGLVFVFAELLGVER